MLQQTHSSDVSHDVIRAKRFELVDDDGNVRGAFALVAERPILSLKDAYGEMRVALCITSDGQPTLSIMDADGEQRAMLTLTENGEPRVVLSDAQGEVIWVAP